MTAIAARLCRMPRAQAAFMREAIPFVGKRVYNFVSRKAIPFMGRTAYNFVSTFFQKRVESVRFYVIPLAQTALMRKAISFIGRKAYDFASTAFQKKVESTIANGNDKLKRPLP